MAGIHKNPIISVFHKNPIISVFHKFISVFHKNPFISIIHKNPFISIFFILQTLFFYICRDIKLLHWQKHLVSATSSFLFYSIQI